MWFSNIYEANDPILNKNSPFISTEDIKFIIQDQEFNIKQYKKEVVQNIEWKKAIPLINVSFHYHLLRDNNIPTLDEFISDYERDNKSFLQLLPNNWLPGIKYRLVRSYPSLVRDIHFVNKTREMGHDTIHTLQLDLHGIDAIVPIDNINAFFRLFFDSKKSRKYLREKQNSHKIDNCVDFGLTSENKNQIGDIYLYSDESIEKIINQTREGFLNINEEIKD